jgi:signal transduction histidine kinase
MVNAQVVAGTLRAQEVDETSLLSALRPPVRSRPLLWRDGGWYSASLQARSDDIPDRMRDGVIAGAPLIQRVAGPNGVILAIGVPIEVDSAAYFEVFDLEALASSLSSLDRTLLVVGVGATVFGAVVGRWISGRVLRRVTAVSDIAERIAGGSLDARLDLGLDPDLTQLATSFNRMADALADRIAREARFASDVSHELRSPLTTLVTAVSVLEGRCGELSPEGREALSLMSADVRRLERTVLDLLEISRHDAGVEELDPELMTVGQAVRRVAGRLVHGPAPINVDPGALGATVSVDLRRLERILANLAENAATHGGGLTRVDVSANRTRALIGVEDHGPGIPPQDREIVFERFARGALSRRRLSTDGTGLGLALAAENAKLMGGAIYVDDHYSPGTRLVLELPLAEP